MLLDVFNQSAFNMISLTNSMNKLPHKPARLGQMGLFASRGVASTAVALEERNGILQLLGSKPRGGPADVSAPVKRKLRNLTIPHFPLDDAVRADDVIGVRKFGTENEQETAVQVVNDKLTTMKQSHEVTLEFLRAGCITGVIRDGELEELVNLFTFYGITELSVDFRLGTATTKVRSKALEVLRLIEDALGAGVYDHVHAFCGRRFFERFIAHADAEKAYDRWQDGAFLRSDPRSGFPFADIIWEEYRGKVAGVDFIHPDHARFVPVGVPGLFEIAFAPADMMSAVGTMGLPYYASQELQDHGKGISLHTQSNPMPYCTRPAVLVKGFTSN